MPWQLKYCSQCGSALATQVVEGRPRVVCPVCARILYENPLPVASAVVLNSRREVLLVKRLREPHRGEWCLPMGFAERGETIADAARRELKEETGVEGRVVRLIDADSFASDYYGDLLIVAFEVEKIGGREKAGDDAAEVRYFPLAGRPPLAFTSNEKALRVCAAAHEEEWSIRDSFATLQSDEDRVMLSDALVTLIQERATEVVALWVADVRSSPSTPSYHTTEPAALAARAAQALAQLGAWLKGDTTDGLRAFYLDVARERKAQQFKLHEVLSAVALLKKHVWTFVRSQGSWERPVDVYRLLELNRRIAVFFDKATYRVARGFDAELPPVAD